jgi:hypothetical protein
MSTPEGIDPELEAHVLQQETERQEDAGHLSRHPDTGWPNGLKVVVILVCVGLIMNGLGLLAIIMTGRNIILNVDCNNADRLAEISQGLEKGGILKNGTITIKPCDKEGD